MTVSVYIDKTNQEWIYDYAEDRNASNCLSNYDFIKLPSGSIQKLIGKKPILGYIYKLQDYEKKILSKSSFKI